MVCCRSSCLFGGINEWELGAWSSRGGVAHDCVASGVIAICEQEEGCVALVLLLEHGRLRRLGVALVLSLEHGQLRRLGRS